MLVSGRVPGSLTASLPLEIMMGKEDTQLSFC